MIWSIARSLFNSWPSRFTSLFICLSCERCRIRQRCNLRMLWTRSAPVCTARLFGFKAHNLDIFSRHMRISAAAYNRW